ncbi:hypothetical protein [Chlorogloeopsis sp. ULAP02]
MTSFYLVAISSIYAIANDCHIFTIRIQEATMSILPIMGFAF